MGARLVSLSKDPALRVSREHVLRTAGYSVLTATWLDDITDAPSDLDLLVLCHGYNDVEAEAILRDARARWPGIRALYLSPQLAGRALLEAVAIALTLPVTAARLRHPGAL